MCPHRLSNRSTDLWYIYRPDKETNTSRKRCKYQNVVGTMLQTQNKMQYIITVSCWAQTGASHPINSNLINILKFSSVTRVCSFETGLSISIWPGFWCLFSPVPELFVNLSSPGATSWHVSSQHISTYQLFRLHSVSPGHVTCPKFRMLPPKVEEW